MIAPRVYNHGQKDVVTISKTVREIATQLHISKQAVYQRMDSMDGFRDAHLIKVGNHYDVDDEGVKLLINFDTNGQQEHHQVIDDVKRYQDAMFEQLKANRKQIDDLIKTLDQQQQLQLATTKENNELKQRIKRLEIQGPDAEDTADNSGEKGSNSANNSENNDDSAKEEKPRKRHFWDLFRK